MATPRTVAFQTLGCKLNFSETSSLGKLFANAGYQEVTFDSPSDLYIINTCSVTDEADKKCRKAVRTAIRQNAQAQIIVVGCYAQLKPQEIASIPGVNMVLGASEKFKILDYIHKRDFDSPHAVIYSNEISSLNEFVPAYSIDDRTRSFLKIQDGCDYKCSFCTIPLARGKSRSGTVQSIVETAEELLQKGVKEIVLTGVNIGDFGNGTDVLEGKTVKKQALFLDLIKALDKIEKPCRFRISSIEPNLCSSEIIDFVAQSNHFMPHFHMPLQSGDNEILSSMRRRYKRELYEERVHYIKTKIPHACIGADVIVGFPGEHLKHFQNTYQFINQLDISYLHVFTYSERNNTAAIHFTDSVNPNERHQRSHQLRILSEKKKRSFYEQFENSRQEILVENKIENGKLSGFSKNYLRVEVENKPGYINQTLSVQLDKLNPELRFNASILETQKH
ncbi:MAG: tRNA (N(6)-L-threonylcarbamoyladenosine(37)-C(2))-methylthiotransferase MtaB [Saprospiraceae bacterium]